MRHAAVYGLFLLALTAFRLVYFGAPLPNTYYAKVGGIPLSDGLLYVADFLVDGAVFLLVPTIVSLAYRPAHRASGALVLAFILYCIAIGGDTFWDSRMLVVALPLLAAVSAHGTAHAWQRRPLQGTVLLAGLAAFGIWCLLGKAAGIALAVALTGTGCVAVWLDRRSVGSARWLPALCLAGIAICMAARGFPLPNKVDMLFFGPDLVVGPAPRSRRLEQIRQLHHGAETLAAYVSNILLQEEPRPRLVASVGIGRLGYLTGLPILDMTGIVDPVVARSRRGQPSDQELVLPGHQRSNVRYLLRRRPDFIVIPDAREVAIPAIRRLLATREFQRLYVRDARGIGYRLRLRARDAR
jgi:hypothetical protein